MVGSAGNDYMFTAGHCHSGTWQTQAQTVGTTTHNYLTATSGNDFQSIQIPGGGIDAVWTNGSNVALVSGALYPAVGAPITYNGSFTGEMRGNTVTKVGVEICDIEGSSETGYQDYCIVNQVIAQNPNGTSICQKGDSGGPVYSHTPGTDVEAVGIISAGLPGGVTCYATLIDHIAFITHTTLITT